MAWPIGNDRSCLVSGGAVDSEAIDHVSDIESEGADHDSNVSFSDSSKSKDLSGVSVRASDNAGVKPRVRSSGDDDGWDSVVALQPSAGTVLSLP